MPAPRPPKAPSAMDGYRRLARTRGALPSVAADGVVAPRRRRRPSIARAAGALRLVAFVGVLVIIVGTSVGLASSDQRGSAARTEPLNDAAVTSDPAPRAETVTVVDTRPVEPTLRASSKAAADEPVDEPVPEPAAKPVVEPVAAEVVPTPSAAPVTAAAPGPTRALPFTGELDAPRVLLAGALLVLVGMLVQVAGQPLPARARSPR